jgi:hypothetical protein
LAAGRGHDQHSVTISLFAEIQLRRLAQKQAQHADMIIQARLHQRCFSIMVRRVGAAPSI